jgi:hypothetical protein
MAVCATTWTVLPHDPIQPIDDRLWRVEGTMDSGLRRTQSIIRLDDGRIVLHAGRSWMAIPPDTLRRATQAGLQLPPPPITYTVPPAAVLVSLALGGYAWSRWRRR